MRLSFGGMLSVLLWAALAQAATLEIPAPNAIQSGIGIISGWKCRANGHLTIRIDGGGPSPLVYGSDRGDTRSVCGDANNGFVATFNYALLGAGRHTAIVYDNGVEFDRATFTVVTTGVEFLRGVTGSGTAILSNGQRATLQWSEAVQGFVPTDFTPPPTLPVSGVCQPVSRHMAIHEPPDYANISLSPCGSVPRGCVRALCLC